MPVSLAPQDFLESKNFSIQSGLHRITKSRVKVNKFNDSKAGETYDPRLVWSITWLPIDEAGAAIGDAIEDDSIAFAPGFDEKWDPEKISLAPADEPGKPKPLIVGAEGRILEHSGNGTTFKGFKENSKVARFISSLAECQFDAARFAVGDMSILEGTEGFAYIKEVTNTGTDKKTNKPLAPTKFPTFQAGTIRRFGYDHAQAPGTVNNMVPATAPMTGSVTQGAPPAASAAPLAAPPTVVDPNLAVMVMAKIREAKLKKGETKALLNDVVKGLLPYVVAAAPKAPNKSDLCKSLGAIYKDESLEFYSRPGVDSIVSVGMAAGPDGVETYELEFK